MTTSDWIKEAELHLRKAVMMLIRSKCGTSEEAAERWAKFDINRFDKAAFHYFDEMVTIYNTVSPEDFKTAVDSDLKIMKRKALLK